MSDEAKTQGPFPLEKLKQLADSGRLNRSDKVSKSESGPWQPAGSIKQLANLIGDHNAGSESGESKGPSWLRIGGFGLLAVTVVGFCGCRDDAGEKRTPPAAQETANEQLEKSDTEASANPGGLAATDAPDTEKTAAPKPLQPTPPDGKDLLTNTIGMKLKLIPAGEFQMGSPTGEAHRRDDEHQHRVRISQPFYMQTTEVTQGQWESVMRTTPWSGKSHVKEGTDYPASYVSWDDAVEFCRKLSAKDGVEYRLPSEAEWEYACRGGSSTAYSFGDNASALGDYAWFFGNAFGIGEQYARRVGQKRANGFGLYDMHGNVYEWCSDWYDSDYYKSSPLADPRGPSGGSDRVYRGCCWCSTPQNVRSALRAASSPDLQGSDLGFRVLRSSVLSGK
jgi:sulfatase modifying factor 1